jgi:hypothetical protein
LPAGEPPLLPADPLLPEVLAVGPLLPEPLGLGEEPLLPELPADALLLPELPGEALLPEPLLSELAGPVPLVGTEALLQATSAAMTRSAGKDENTPKLDLLCRVMVASRGASGSERFRTRTDRPGCFPDPTMARCAGAKQTDQR